MSTETAVSENDLRTMLRIINVPELGDDGCGLAWSTLEALEALIPCQWIAFNGIDVNHQWHYFQQGTGSGEREAHRDEKLDCDDAFWFHYPESPCSYPERSGDLRTVAMTTDFYSRHKHRQTPMYIDVIGPNGGDHEIMVCLPDGPGRQLRLIVWRGRNDPDFTERDRALLTLLRPHLHTAHIEVLRREVGIPELTKRQWELLGLVDAGLSNTQIARRLHVTENTVRKHLENIYRRLSVSSRTAALSKAFPERTLTGTNSPASTKASPPF
jgi:DNA-binding CsgD family transcriptional regulator